MALAHNRLGLSNGALANFHGFHGIDPHGFNRNGFGGPGNWNGWARANWGAGWNNWGSGYGYWAGPVFWPFFYGDVLSFALWPYDLYNPFFLYGPDYLLTSIFWPGPYFGYDYAGYYAPFFDIYDYPFGYYPPGATDYYAYYHHHRRHHYRHHHYRRPTAPEANAEPGGCGGLAPGVAELPVRRITRAIDASYQQMAMLDNLQKASDKANAILRASCPSEVPLTPVGRLNAVTKRLDAMLQAIDVLRSPLVTFDQSLDPQQRKKLARLGAHGARKPVNTGVNEASNTLAQLCQKQTGSFTLLPVDRINQIIKPTDKQMPSFDKLKTASTTAAQQLEASCPPSMPATAADRLDAIVKRIHALGDAVKTVQPALVTFYASLSDEQKARFNVIGSERTAAAPAAQQKTGG